MNLKNLLKISYNPFRKTIIRKYGRCEVARGVKIRRSRIFVAEGAELVVGAGAEIIGTDIFVAKGRVELRECCRLIETKLTVDNGDVTIGDHSLLRARRAWVRFGGVLTVGRYTNINAGSEIRCDERVDIGDFIQISYNVNIWDTNTHTILSKESRREVTEKHFPAFGYESSRPATAPVTIGSDSWLGMNTAILKGSTLGEEVIVGYGTVIAGKSIPLKSTVVSADNLKIIPHK